MKPKTILWLVGILIVSALILSTIKSIRLDMELKAMKKDYAEYKNIVVANDEIRAEREKEKDRVIEDKTKRIAELMANVGKPTPAEKEKDREIADLKKKMGEYEASEDLAGALSEAKKTIAAWEIKFSLAEDRHKNDMLNLNAEWQGKYDALNVIARDRLAAITDRDLQIQKLEKIVKTSEKRWGVFNLFGLRINLMRDVVIPSGTFAIGYVLGSKK